MRRRSFFRCYFSIYCTFCRRL